MPDPSMALFSIMGSLLFLLSLLPLLYSLSLLFLLSLFPFKLSVIAVFLYKVRGSQREHIHSLSMQNCKCDLAKKVKAISLATKKAAPLLVTKSHHAGITPGSHLFPFGSPGLWKGLERVVAAPLGKGWQPKGTTLATCQRLEKKATKRLHSGDFDEIGKERHH